MAAPIRLRASGNRVFDATGECVPLSDGFLRAVQPHVGHSGEWDKAGGWSSCRVDNGNSLLFYRRGAEHGVARCGDTLIPNLRVELAAWAAPVASLLAGVEVLYPVPGEDGRWLRCVVREAGGMVATADGQRFMADAPTCVPARSEDALGASPPVLVGIGGDGTHWFSRGEHGPFRPARCAPPVALRSLPPSGLAAFVKSETGWVAAAL